MYVGRFVVAGRTASGRRFLGYRVSSRSFPDRQIVIRGDTAAVLPTPDAPPSDNPYIRYNCLRVEGGAAIVANGSHVDPIAERVAAGYPLRDAVALALLALGYERDAYGTPRIVAAWAEQTALLGIISTDKLLVNALALEPGQARLIATYGLTEPVEVACPGETAESLAEALWGLPYEHPVAALGALLDETLSLAVHGPA